MEMLLFCTAANRHFPFQRIQTIAELLLPQFPQREAPTSLSCACSFLCLTPKVLLMHQLKENAGAAEQNRQLTTDANKYSRL